MTSSNPQSASGVKMNQTDAAAAINAADLLSHIEKLASDEFEGRKPGTLGEERSVDYLVARCKELGLELGDPLSGYVQKISVTGLTAQPRAEFACPSGKVTMNSLAEFVARSGLQQERTTVADSEVVFVGYGIVAPEYGWNDFKDLDVRGKTIITLIGDPRRPDESNAGQFDESFFKGKALTYYGRWTYKYEIAQQLGAAAVFIIHDTERAGYGYDVVTSSWGTENLYLTGDNNRALVEGWLCQETAQRIFDLAGLSLSELTASAQRPEFRPASLGLKANIEVKSTVRKFTTCNVIGKIEGTDQALKDECIVYCAHWDHFGKKINADGSIGIYSGAADNGSGVATILEIAKSYQLLKEGPRRSILFLFTTLEESGLLGAKHYVEKPAMPLAATLAIINVDSLNMWGRTRKFVSIARGHSSLDDVLARHAAAQGREVVGDREPEKGYFFRSDHLEFLRKGVPALFALNPGDDYIGQPPDYGVSKRRYFLANDYHKVTDKVKPDWDLSGLAEDAQLFFLAGLEIANSDSRPVWSDSSEFKVERQAMLIV